MWSVKKWREYRKEYYLKNRDKLLAYAKNHPHIRDEKRKKYEKEWKLKNKDRCLEYSRKWKIKTNYKESSENKRVRQCQRRAIERKAKGKFTLKEWEDLKRKFNYICLNCNRSEPEIKLTIDHIKPLIKGGTNSIKNIQPLCSGCNSKKGTSY